MNIIGLNQIHPRTNNNSLSALLHIPWNPLDVAVFFFFWGWHLCCRLWARLLVFPNFLAGTPRWDQFTWCWCSRECGRVPLQSWAWRWMWQNHTSERKLGDDVDMKEIGWYRSEKVCLKGITKGPHRKWMYLKRMYPYKALACRQRVKEASQSLCRFLNPHHIMVF